MFQLVHVVPRWACSARSTALVFNRAQMAVWAGSYGSAHSRDSESVLNWFWARFQENGCREARRSARGFGREDTQSVHVERDCRGGCRSGGIGRHDVQNVPACDPTPASTCDAPVPCQRAAIRRQRKKRVGGPRREGRTAIPR
jgi:hypothetical protein